MQVIARPLGQPALGGGGLVGSIVVQDQAHVEVRGYGRIDPVEEAPELCGSVPAMAGADDLPSLDVEGSEEGDRPVTTVIMSAALESLTLLVWTLDKEHKQPRGSVSLLGPDTSPKRMAAAREALQTAFPSSLISELLKDKPGQCKYLR